MSCFASLVAPFGGFFASGFKRAFNIKDFGHSIPGHGGMTDRMDCQYVTLPPFVVGGELIHCTQQILNGRFHLRLLQQSNPYASRHTWGSTADNSQRADGGSAVGVNERFKKVSEWPGNQGLMQYPSRIKYEWTS